MNFFDIVDRFGKLPEATHNNVFVKNLDNDNGWIISEFLCSTVQGNVGYD